MNNARAHDDAFERQPYASSSDEEAVATHLVLDTLYDPRRTSSDLLLLPEQSIQDLHESMRDVPSVVQETLGIPSRVSRLELHIADEDGLVSSSRTPDGHKISVRISGRYLAGLSSSARLHEAEGVLYNQTTLQILGTSLLPEWAKTGLADYMRLKYERPNMNWEEHDGGRPMDGWSVVAFFFQWLVDRHGDDLLRRLVASSAADRDFEATLECFTGSSLKELWNVYQDHILPPNTIITHYQASAQHPPMTLRDLGGSALFLQALPRCLEYCASAFTICMDLLYPTSSYSPKHVSRVDLRLLPSPIGVAWTSSETVSFSMPYLEKFLTAKEGRTVESVRQEIQGILVHEMVHVVQYDGHGTAPSGLTEGIADYCRLRAGLAPPTWSLTWRRGEKWDSGYSTTAYFLDWVDRTRCAQFVPKCNRILQASWDPTWCQKETGSGWEELWTEFQAELHSNIPES